MSTPLDTSPPGEPASRFRRLPWGTLLVEAVFTVAAILLALAADDWRQRREERRLADTALATFAMELRDNQRRLAEVFPYHDSLAIGLENASRQLDRGEPFSMAQLQPRFRGVIPPMLLSTAWDAALSTGALRHVEYGIVSELAALYSRQAELHAINETMFATIVSPDVVGRGDYAMLVRLGSVFFNDVIPRERQLTEGYAELLRRLPPVADTGVADRAGTDSLPAHP